MSQPIPVRATMPAGLRRSRLAAACGVGACRLPCGGRRCAWRLWSTASSCISTEEPSARRALEGGRSIPFWPDGQMRKWTPRIADSSDGRQEPDQIPIAPSPGLSVPAAGLPDVARPICPRHRERASELPQALFCDGDGAPRNRRKADDSYRCRPRWEVARSSSSLFRLRERVDDGAAKGAADRA